MAKDKEYDHPHYDDMVVETIRSQHKGKRGLTEKQILKHILKNYDVDKERAPSEVKHSIKRMTKSGKIVHYQFKYKMPTHPDRKEWKNWFEIDLKRTRYGFETPSFLRIMRKCNWPSIKAYLL